MAILGYNRCLPWSAARERELSRVVRVSGGQLPVVLSGWGIMWVGVGGIRGCGSAEVSRDWRSRLFRTAHAWMLPVQPQRPTCHSLQPWNWQQQRQQSGSLTQGTAPARLPGRWAA